MKIKRWLAVLSVCVFGTAHAGPIKEIKFEFDQYRYRSGYDQSTLTIEDWAGSLFYEAGSRNVVGFQAHNIETGYGWTSNFDQPLVARFEGPLGEDILQVGTAYTDDFEVTDIFGNMFEFHFTEIRVGDWGGLDGYPTLDNPFGYFHGIIGDTAGFSYLRSLGYVSNPIDGQFDGKRRGVAVPEPASVGLAGLGIAAISFMRRRRQAA